MIRIILATRAAHRALMATAALAAITYLAGTWTLRIDLSPARPNELVISDLCGIACATVVAIITGPRLWEWERAAGGHRARLVATTTALAGVALPVLCAAAVIPHVAGRTDWLFAVTNVLALAALIQLVAPFVGPLWAGALAVVTWYGSGLVQNLVPEAITFLPITGYPTAEPRTTAAGLLTVVTLVVHARTLGSTARRRARA
ncbi:MULTISPECIES: hypothetical protein [Prauserella salsuginis group]|uniref:Uncharacterized protein n=1 Tax=Prauserella salsuginis TaxID=387889 RepID=A0ABW6G008_9PSEU|nr:MULTISPECIES: hypothetical protein [Prauserella salsuginis group]MCR3721149.1 hypothetical protein [Prauserella flava]MCR3734771.1 hypothetical protein [Prauserella salsuginis]